MIINHLISGSNPVFPTIRNPCKIALISTWGPLLKRLSAIQSPSSVSPTRDPNWQVFPKICFHSCFFANQSVDLTFISKGIQSEPLNFHSLYWINPKAFLGDTLLVWKQVFKVSPRCPLASKRNLERLKVMNP